MILPPFRICLLTLACAVPIAGCGDSKDDENSGVGSAGTGGASGGAAGGGGTAGQDAASPCDGVTPELMKISASELDAMLDTKDFELINVHVPYAGEIPGTDAHIRYSDTASLEAHLGNDVGAKAVLYCLTGPMSAIAGKALVELGYCQIYDIPAGMVGWEAEGYPVDDDD